jgi:hypothetical protein
MLYPRLYPTLTNPSAIITTTSHSYYKIGSTINFTVGSEFNRGLISPDYSTSSPHTNSPRSGLPNIHRFSSSDANMIISDVVSTELDETYNVTDYIINAGIVTLTSNVGYDAGVQPVDSNGNNYDSPLPSGNTTPHHKTIEGCYAIFATTSYISVMTEQTLISMLNTVRKNYTLVGESGSDKQRFDIPDDWGHTLTAVMQLNTLTNQYEYPGGSPASSLALWDVTSYTHTVWGATVNYKRYTYNGPTRGSVGIQLVFG